MPRGKLGWFVPRKGAVEEALNQRRVRDGLQPAAERVLAAAKASAPVDTGDYRDSLRIEYVKTDRWVARIISDAPYGGLVEADRGTLMKALTYGRR